MQFGIAPNIPTCATSCVIESGPAIDRYHISFLYMRFVHINKLYSRPVFVVSIFYYTIMTSLPMVGAVSSVDLVTNDDSRKILIGEDPKQETRPKKL